MGCDIHFRVEFYAPEQTLVWTPEGLKVATDPASWAWRPAETLTPNEDLARYQKIFDDGHCTQEQLDAWIRKEPRYSLSYEHRFYTRRNYALFYKLSGVREWDNGIVPMSMYGNGLPDDMSPEVQEELEEWGDDLHSQTHYTLTRLLEEDWDAFDQEHYSGFSSTIINMQVVALQNCGGNTDHVRAVFGFDN